MAAKGSIVWCRYMLANTASNDPCEAGMLAFAFMQLHIGEIGKVPARNIEHGRGFVKAMNAGNTRGRALDHEPRAGADVCDNGLGIEVGARYGIVAHLLREVSRPHLVPVACHILEIRLGFAHIPSLLPDLEKEALVFQP